MSHAPYSEEPASAAEQAPDDEGGISMLDLAIALAKHKLLVAGLPLLAAMIAGVYAFFLTDLYTATTKIFPPQQNQSSASAMLGQLGALVGLAGGAVGRNSNEIYVALLSSRTVADALIKRFDLHTLYKAKTLEGTRKTLAGSTTIAAGKDGLILISVDDSDPKRAAAIANAYVDELYKLSQSMALTEASQRRLFFERQLAQARESLARAESAARRALDAGGIVQVEGQGRVRLETNARLRGQITVKEIELAAMRTFAAENNPDLLRAQVELEAIRNELARLEGGTRKSDAPRTGSQQGVDSFHLLRNVKYYETMHDLLAKQYEIARIDEAKDASLIQVLDSAIEPEQKSKPPKKLIVLIAAAAALVIASMIALLFEALNAAGARPGEAHRINLLKHYLRWR